MRTVAFPPTALREVSLLQMLSQSHYVVRLLSVEHVTNKHQKPLLYLVFEYLDTGLPRTAPKSTIEPCSNSDACSSLVGYTLYTNLKVSEVASLFSIDPVSLLLTNAIDVENHILPSQLFLKIPIPCACVDGIRKARSGLERHQARCWCRS